MTDYFNNIKDPPLVSISVPDGDTSKAKVTYDGEEMQGIMDMNIKVIPNKPPIVSMTVFSADTMVENAVIESLLDHRIERIKRLLEDSGKLNKDELISFMRSILEDKING